MALSPIICAKIITGLIKRAVKNNGTISLTIRSEIHCFTGRLVNIITAKNPEIMKNVGIRNDCEALAIISAVKLSSGELILHEPAA